MTPEFTYHLLTGKAELEEALRLQANRYLDAGYLDEPPADGFTVDEFVEQSTYFGARDAHGEIIGVSRLIRNTPERTLPALGHMALRPRWSDWVTATNPKTIAEFSAFAIAPKPGAGVTISRGLFQVMTQHTLLRTDATFWCAAVSSRLLPLLDRAIDLQYEQLGEEVFYRGAMTKPILVDVIGQYQHYDQTNSPDRDFFYSGLDVDPVHRRAIANNPQSLALPANTTESTTR